MITDERKIALIEMWMKIFFISGKENKEVIIATLRPITPQEDDFLNGFVNNTMGVICEKMYGSPQEERKITATEITKEQFDAL